MKRKVVMGGIILVAIGIGMMLLKKVPPRAVHTPPTPPIAKHGGEFPLGNDVNSQRELELPVYSPLPEETPIIIPPSSEEDRRRAEGREKRKRLPLGIVLWDNVNVYENAAGSGVLYRMMTSDFVKVYPDTVTNGRYHIHPGVDLYLAETTKAIETAGDRFPDKDGWIDQTNLHVFAPDDAKEFTETTHETTLGNDPAFSTVSFYDRALKNPDVVVRRIIGPRHIALLSIHEDYSPAWISLLNDPDVKIKSVTLAALRERGVGKNARLVDALISRLAQLTQTKATGEAEIEVLTLLRILKESGHPHAQSALKSFAELWAGQQSARVMDLVTSAP